MNFPQDRQADTFHLIPPISAKNRVENSPYTNSQTVQNRKDSGAHISKNKPISSAFFARLPILFAVLILGFGTVTASYASFEFPKQVSDALSNCVNSPKECVLAVSKTSAPEIGSSAIFKDISNVSSSIFSFAVHNSVTLLNSVSIDVKDIPVVSKINSNFGKINLDSVNARDAKDHVSFFSDDIKIVSAASDIFASSVSSGAKNILGAVSNLSTNVFVDLGKNIYKRIQDGYEKIGNNVEVSLEKISSLKNETSENTAIAFSSFSDLRNNITCAIEKFIGIGKAECNLDSEKVAESFVAEKVKDKTKEIDVGNVIVKNPPIPQKNINSQQVAENSLSQVSSDYSAFRGTNINYAYSPIFIQGITKQELESAVASIRSEMSNSAKFNEAQSERIFTRAQKNAKDSNASARSASSADSMTGGTITNSNITGGTITGSTISGGSIDSDLTGTFEGDVTALSFTTNHPLELQEVTPPGDTTDLLYNAGGDLYWNGNLLSSASSGTWTSAGGNVYRLTGNVGLGTSTPWRTLSVNGSSDLGVNALAGYFTATGTVASVFPYASSSALTVSGNSYLGTVSSGLWNGTQIGVAYGGTGLTTAPSYGDILVGNSSGGYTLTATSSLGLTLSDLSGILGVASGGTGLSSYTAGSLIYASDTGTLAGTSTANLKTTLALNNVENTALSTWSGSTNLNTLGTISSGIWNGTAIGDAYITKSGDWTGTFDGHDGAYYLNASNLNNFGQSFYSYFSATTTDALAQGSINKYYSDTLVNSYIHGSSTIAKAYSANTFTGANTFSGTLTVGLLNGPLQANAGVVSATSSIGVLYGGTGATTFGQGWLYSDGGTSALNASTSPTLARIVATSTSLASIFPYASTTAVSASAICLTNDCRTTWSDSTGTIFSSTTLAYFARIGTVPEDAYRVDQFFRALDAAGLTDDLVDGAFLRTSQNAASTSMKTINGVSTTFVGSPSVGPDGLTTNGTSQYAYWAVTPTTAGTVATTYKGVISGQTISGALWSLQNQTGVGTGAGTSGYHLLFNNLATAYVFTGNGSSAAVTSSILDPVSSSASTIHAYNPYEQIDIVTNDNASSPTLKAYVDGKLALSDSFGNIQTTSSLDRFVIGARWYTAGSGGVQSYSRGTHSAWLLFNRDLSSTEVTALTAAMRWLEPKKKNIVYVGDSTSAFLNTKPDDAWTYQHSIMKKQSNARIYNQAVNGQNAQYFINNYDTLIYPFRPGINGVDEADIYIWLGINDINGGATDATTYTRLKTLWARAKSDGFRVFVGTLMPGTSYTSTMEGYRTALNTSIASDQSLYDSLFRPDRLLIDPTDSAYYLDGFHLKAQGNHLIADMLNMDYSLASTTWSTYFSYASSSQLTVRNNLAIGSTTVNSSGFLFSVASSTSSYLNVQTSSGFVGIGTSSPWRTLSVNGSSDLGFNALAGYFTSTSTTASVFPYASTTAFTVSGNSYLGTVSSGVWNGTAIGVTYGGTGLTSAPSYGQLLVGNASGGYTLTATSSLGLGTINVGTQGYFPFYDSASNSLTATSSLFVSQLGKIGVGTTSAYGYTLTIDGGTAISDAGTLFYRNSFNVPPTTAARTNFTGSIGYTFTVDQKTLVTELGRLYVAGNTQNHAVYLWDASNSSSALRSATILASATSDSDSYKWATITPITLVPGTQYILAIDETSGGDAWKDTWANSFHPNFNFVNRTYASSAGAFPTNNNTSGGSIYNTGAMKYKIIATTNIDSDISTRDGLVIESPFGGVTTQTDYYSLILKGTNRGDGTRYITTFNKNGNAGMHTNAYISINGETSEYPQVTIAGETTYMLGVNSDVALNPVAVFQSPGGPFIRGYDNTTGTTVKSLELYANGGAYFKSNIGIGTTSPWGALSISTTTPTGPLFIISTSTAGTATSTAFIVDRLGYLGLATSSPWRTLSVNGSSDLGFNALAGYFTSTSTTASVFPYASTTAITVSGSAFVNNLTITSLTGSTRCLQVDSTGLVSAASSACGSGGSSAGGTWSTTTSTVANRLINYSNNTTDIVTIGGTATTTAQYWFDPNTTTSYLAGNVGIGTTSPYAKLSVAGQIVFDNFFATSTTGTSTIMGALSIGSTTPNATNWFAVGSTTQNLAVNRISGNTTIGSRLLFMKPSNPTQTAEIYTDTDQVNSSVRALYITPPVGASSNRIYLGSASKIAYSLNLTNVSNLESVPPITSSRYSLPNNATPTFNLMGGSSGQQINMNSYYGIVIRPTWNATPSTSYSALGSLTEYGLVVAGQQPATKQFAIIATTSQTASLFELQDSSRNTLTVFDSAGKLGLGTTSPWKTLSVVGGVSINGLTAAASTADAICLNSTTKEVLVNTGAATCTVSSARFKHDINDINVGLKELMKLRPVSFTYNETNENRVGFIAEEVDTIDQRFIFREEDGRPRGVRYEDLVALLTKSIQEQQKQIDGIQKDVISLRSDLNSLLGSNDTGTSTPGAVGKNAFLSQLTANVIDSVKNVTNWTFDKISATFARVDHIEVETLRVSNGIEIVDAETGRLYCITLRYGQFSTRPGKCSVNSPAFNQVGNQNPEDQNHNQIPVDNDNATTTATTTPEHVDVVVPESPVVPPVNNDEVVPAPVVEPIEPVLPPAVIPEPAPKEVPAPAEAPVQAEQNSPEPAIPSPDVVQ